MVRKRASSTASWFALVLAALPAVAEPPVCPDTDIGRVVTATDGLQVIEPATHDLRPDDIVLQLNGHMLHTCADLTTALAEAREQRLARLLLIRRKNKVEAVALQPPSAAGVLAGPGTPPDWFPEPTPTPVAIGSAEAPDVRDVLDQFQDFGRTLQANLPLLSAQPWARRVNDLKQVYERRRASTPSAAALEPILAYYLTVVDILVYKENTVRGNATHEMNQKRQQPNAAFAYHSGSPVSGWLLRYPFLEASVIEAPRTTKFIGWAEANGNWVPDRAIDLLVERALAEGTALADRLAH